MEVFKNRDGSLKKVRSRFSRSREVTLTRWNDVIYLHLNDISKCFASGKFDKTKSKNISMKWEEIEVLRDTFKALVPHVQQMRAEMVGFFKFIYKRVLFCFCISYFSLICFLN